MRPLPPLSGCGAEPCGEGEVGCCHLTGRKGWMCLPGRGGGPRPEAEWRRQALPCRPRGPVPWPRVSSLPLTLLCLCSVASTLTAAVSAGRPPSRASAGGSWGPWNGPRPAPLTSHQQGLPSPRGRHKYVNRRRLRRSWWGVLRKCLENNLPKVTSAASLLSSTGHAQPRPGSGSTQAGGSPSAHLLRAPPSLLLSAPPLCLGH